MKELSIEEKAKAYDKKLAEAKEMLEDGGISQNIIDYIQKLYPELVEPKDERIRKHLLYHFRNKTKKEWNGIPVKDILAWLEKQGEHANFRNKIQIGDKVTRNEDGVLVNLSQLKRVAKKDAKQGEQKPADKVEPKFKTGDWIIFNGLILHIDEMVDGYYRTTSIDGIPNSYDWDIDNVARLWTIQDAKDGDVLAAHECYVIFKEIDGLNIKCYCTYHYLGFNPIFYVNTLQNKEAFQPATKEQRNHLFQKMKEAGYEWDAEKKKLRKIEDEQKPWSEEDESMLQNILEYLKNGWRKLPTDILKYESWLKSLRPQSTWRPSELQLECLDDAIKQYQSKGSRPVILMELLEKLKKLKEGKL